jgi:hypothetical protein
MGSGDATSVADDAPTTTDVPAPTTTRQQSVDTIAPAPRGLDTTTTAPARQPTAEPLDPDRLVKGSIALDPSLTLSPAELVLMTNRGEVVRIDTATGLTITATVEDSEYGPPAIYAGDGWILLLSYNEARGSTVLHDDGTRVTVDAQATWPLFEGGEDGTFWRVQEFESNGAPDTLTEISIDGGETGRTIDLGGFYPQSADPLGGIVVQAPGGNYIVTPEVTTRFTTGLLIALGRSRAVVSECGDSLDCGYFVVDRATGERTPLALDPSLGDPPTIDSGWWAFRRPMSPDESAVLVTYWDQTGNGRQASGVIDLVTGGFREIDDAIDTPMMEWSPDGRQVYWLDSGRLQVFDRASGESVLVSEDLPAINAFTIRPSLPSGDEPTSTTAAPDGVDTG